MLTFEQIMNSPVESDQGALSQALCFMTRNGSDVRLEWGCEGNQVWECSWTLRRRGVLQGFGNTPAKAALSCLNVYADLRTRHDPID
jgi:hypothetical protein